MTLDDKIIELISVIISNHQFLLPRVTPGPHWNEAVKRLKELERLLKKHGVEVDGFKPKD